ncbi:MAG: hypothetical protein GYA02_10175 [Clostridiaceae bacterium]|nr:hypothetical protein [Clostridiaceae bacterium]
MVNEIGSEFWLNSTPDEYNKYDEYKNEIPEWISKFGNVVLTLSGRGAISLLLKEIKVREKIALLPAYICESVILPFIQSGYTCYFYSVDTDLTPNQDNIISNYADIGVFVHMGYYGYPTNYGLQDIIKHLKQKSVIIVEDITQTLFSDYQRFEENDYYVASLRKWVGLPGGGFLASPKKDIKNPPRQSNETFVKMRQEALTLKGRYISGGGKNLKPKYLELFSKSEELLSKDYEPYCMDDLSKALISKLDILQLKEKRCTNFRTLAYGMKYINYVEPVFSGLLSNVCPMFYPVYIKNIRDEVQQVLIQNQIYCPIHWPVPRQLKLDKFKNTLSIYKNILSIPCDQRYDSSDMERVVSTLMGIRGGY